MCVPRPRSDRDAHQEADIATILIVDDLAANRIFLVTLLRHHGHRVLEAANGTEGLGLARNERPDLVISDVLMPVMDGYEFVRQLRLDPATRTIPVVFYTAHYGEREARALARSGGVFDVLTKPSESAEVLRVVGRVMAGEAELTLPPGASPIASNFDREHLRLLTDKVSEKAGELRAANARLRALINIGLEFGSDRDSARRLERVCSSARDLFGATCVTLGILNRNARTVEKVAGSGAGAAEWIRTGDAVGGLLATVVSERRPARGDNPGGDPTTLSLPTRHPPVDFYLAVPILSSDCVYGWICLVGTEGRTFTDDDEQLMLALAGHVGHFYELEREVVERKQAELALRDERDRAQRFLDTADVILLALDLSGRITLINRKGCEVLGWTERELVGRDWMDTCVPAGQRDVWRRTFALLMNDQVPVGENVVLVRSGQERLIEWRNTMLRDAAGHIVGALSSGADITDRRTLEGQYQQSQKLEALGRLAGGVAHDFNNLLNVILGYCEILLARAEPGDTRFAEIIEIQKAGTSGAGLTRQLLAFSRKQIIEPTLLDLNAVVSDMQPMLGRLIGEAVTFALALRSTLGLVKADRGQIEQIVLNLAVNARDAMPDGGTLTIETANVDLDVNYPATHLAVTPGPYVVLTVTDTGAGMSEHVLARLFEPFFTTKDPGQGTGLGLATVHGIVAANGGCINVYSEIDRGTSFKVYFPMAEAVDQVAEMPPPSPPQSLGGTETVLVVEDSQGLRELTRRLLQQQGYTVLVAASANEALKMFAGDVPIDLMLTDVVLPGRSGPDLTRQLMEQWPALRVIYMSGYTEDAIVQRGVMSLGSAFLQKPFTAEALGRKMRETLDP